MIYIHVYTCIYICIYMYMLCSVNSICFSTCGFETQLEMLFRKHSITLYVNSFRAMNHITKYNSRRSVIMTHIMLPVGLFLLFK